MTPTYSQLLITQRTANLTFHGFRRLHRSLAEWIDIDEQVSRHSDCRCNSNFLNLELFRWLKNNSRVGITRKWHTVWFTLVTAKVRRAIAYTMYVPMYFRSRIRYSTNISLVLVRRSDKKENHARVLLALVLNTPARLVYFGKTRIVYYPRPVLFAQNARDDETLMV